LTGRVHHAHQSHSVANLADAHLHSSVAHRAPLSGGALCAPDCGKLRNLLRHFHCGNHEEFLGTRTREMPVNPDLRAFISVNEKEIY
jgi:hypothetical protein